MEQAAWKKKSQTPAHVLWQKMNPNKQEHKVSDSADESRGWTLAVILIVSGTSLILEIRVCFHQLANATSPTGLCVCSTAAIIKRLPSPPHSKLQYVSIITHTQIQISDQAQGKRSFTAESISLVITAPRAEQISENEKRCRDFIPLLSRPCCMQTSPAALDRRSVQTYKTVSHQVVMQPLTLCCWFTLDALTYREGTFFPLFVNQLLL